MKLHFDLDCNCLLERIDKRLLAQLIFVSVAIFIVTQSDQNGLSAAKYPGNSQQEEPQKIFGEDPEDDTPLIDRDPFDRIHLNAANNNAIMSVQPIPLERLSDRSKPLRFYLLDRLERNYQVPWNAVVKVEKYDEILINEAEAAFRNNDFDTAFRNFVYLYDKRGATDAKLKKTMEQFLFRDGSEVYRQQKFELAVSVFEELYKRNRSFRGDSKRSIIDVIAICYERIIEPFNAKGDFGKVSSIIQGIEKKYPKMPGALGRMVEKQRARTVARGQEILKLAIESAKSGDPVKAHRSVRQLAHAMPELEQTPRIFKQVIDRFPYVFVGVTQPARYLDFSSVDNWAARRVGRLTQRSLVEFTALGDDGGKYEFSEGRIIAVDQLGIKYRFELTPEKNRFDSDPLTVYQLASRIRALTNEDSPEFYFPLAKIVSQVEIIDNQTLELTLETPFVRPDALMQVPLMPNNTEQEVAEDENNVNVHLSSNTPDADEAIRVNPIPKAKGVDVITEFMNDVYKLTRKTNDTMVFEVNPLLKKDASQQYPQVVERQFENASLATDALIHGEVDIIDRVFPADIKKLRENDLIEVKRYLLPTVHMLIPNPRNVYMQNQTFRRGLLYGVNRELIVNQVICGGTEYSGFAPISGPFPFGTEDSDQIGYGYDDKVQPAEFSVHMAIVSPAVVMKRLRDAERKKLYVKHADELDGLEEEEQYAFVEKLLNEDDSFAPKKLVLVHPTTDIAIVACESMQQMWARAGIEVELKPLEPGITRPSDTEYDLLYVELTVQEPLVDARHILGELGLATNINASIDQLLQEIDVARSWVDVRLILRQLHQQTNYDAAVLPLWQTSNFYAYRRNIRGVGEELIELYQNVERWRIVPPEVAKTTAQKSKK